MFVKLYSSKIHVLGSRSNLSDHFSNLFKASVRYFLSNFYFSPNDNPSKTMKNVSYFIFKALFVLEIFKFSYFCLSLFFSLSAIALEADRSKS